MRFVADAMLGKLSRFLRMLGHDVIYLPDSEDTFVLYTAKETNRILLTKDTWLHHAAIKCHTQSVLIQSNHVKEQLKEIHSKLQLKGTYPARCALCNGPLQKVSKYEIEGLVPEFVWHRNNTFWRCTMCGKIYWRGSHIKNFKKFLGYDPWE